MTHTQERRQRLKARGLCVDCERPAQPGRLRCKPCALYNSEQSQAARKRRMHGKANVTKGRAAGALCAASKSETTQASPLETAIDAELHGCA